MKDVNKEVNLISSNYAFENIRTKAKEKNKLEEKSKN